MSYDYDRSKTAGTKLDAGVRRMANARLSKLGLDGNGRFRKPGEGLAKAQKALEEFNIEMDEVVTSLSGKSGQKAIRVALSPKDRTNEDPTPLSNTSLSIQWQELKPGQYEVTANLS